jgi:hypothetical protein
VGGGTDRAGGPGVVTRALSVVALALGATLIAAALLHGDDPGLPSVQDVEVSGGPERVVHGFGDRVPVVLDVLVPGAAVDPASVRLEPGFAPYEVAGRVGRSRVDDGATSLVRFRFALDCLEHACLPGEAGGGLLPAPASIRFTRANGAPGSVSVLLPQLLPRTQGEPAAGLLAWRADVRPPEELTFRAPPRLVAGALGGLAVLALAGALVVLVPRAVRALPGPRPPIDRRSVLDRALAAVRTAAAAGDSSERRRALDLLARELRSGARRTESREARRLAWSRHSPAAAEMEELADRVERAGA